MDGEDDASDTIKMRDPEHCWWQRERDDVRGKLEQLQRCVQSSREEIAKLSIKTAIFAFFGAALASALVSAIVGFIFRAART